MTQLLMCCEVYEQYSKKILKLCFKRVGALVNGLVVVKKVSNDGGLPATTTPGW